MVESDFLGDASRGRKSTSQHVATDEVAVTNRHQLDRLGGAGYGEGKPGPGQIDLKHAQ